MYFIDLIMKLIFSKKHILILLLISIKFNGLASGISDTTFKYGTLESGAYKRFSILPTGVHYEMLGNKKNSIILSAQINHTAGWGYANANFLFYYLIQPKLTIEYRYYYNQNRREKKKRWTDFRSLNYLGILMENKGDQYPVFVFYKKRSSEKTVYDRNFCHHEVSYLGPVWGLQRTIGERKRMYWSTEIGIGYNISKNKTRAVYEKKYDDWAIIGDFFSIGFVL